MEQQSNKCIFMDIVYTVRRGGGRGTASILRVYNQVMGSIFSKQDVFQNFPQKQVSSPRVTEQAVTATMNNVINKHVKHKKRML